MMKPEEWQKVSELLEQALELKPAERGEFCAAIGASSPGLQREVESLLACEDNAEQFLVSPNIAFSTALFVDEKMPDALEGQQIGVYRIEREIGFGGMGAVYLASRSDGKFEQKVAVKMLKRELNTAAVRRRFQHEQQILSKLEHPHIARLLDTGTTADGVPYLVMEYIAGEPVNRYCEREHLNLTDKLKLFRTICAAVTFAHQNLIVHRDLKPSNILVTKDGTPKLLDFGIAKLLSADAENAAAQTVTNLGAMTPEYASPEQIRGESVTTATDVYSLGVILYELLTAHRPFELKTKSIKEILQAVCETEPTAPSRSIADDASPIKEVEFQTSETAHTLLLNEKKTAPIKYKTYPKSSIPNPKFLKGDLDNIVLKSLKKNVAARYSSVEQFSEDIRRHLAGLPVLARPDTFSYRAEKFIVRHKFGILAALLIFFSLLGGVSATVWQARRARQKELLAQQRFVEARKIANSFLFEIYPQIENLQGATAAKETLVKRALEYLDNLAAQSTDDAGLERELAAAYEKVGDVQGMPDQPNLGDLNGASESYQKARNLRESLVADNHADSDLRDELATNYEHHGVILWWLSETAQTVALYEKALPLRRSLVAENPQSFIYRKNLAGLLLHWGDVPSWNNKPVEALKYFGEAQTILQKLTAGNPSDQKLKTTLARCLIRIGRSRQDTGDFDGAIKTFENSRSIFSPLAAADPSSYDFARGLYEVKFGECEVYLTKKDGSQAVEICSQLVELAITLNKKDQDSFTSHDLATGYAYSGQAFLLDHEPQKAAQELRNSLDLYQKLIAEVPDDDENKRGAADALNNLGQAQLQIGQLEAALKDQQQAQSLLAEIIDHDPGNAIPHLDLANVLQDFGNIYAKQNKNAEAREMFSRALEILQKLDAENSLTVNDKKSIGEISARISRLEGQK